LIELGGQSCRANLLTEVAIGNRQILNTKLNNMKPYKDLYADTPLSDGLAKAYIELRNRQDGTPGIVLYTDAGESCEDSLPDPCDFVEYRILPELERQLVFMRLVLIGYNINKNGNEFRDQSLRCIERLGKSEQRLDVKYFKTSNIEQLEVASKEGLRFLGLKTSEEFSFGEFLKEYAVPISASAATLTSVLSGIVWLARRRQGITRERR
ncbi:MAG: hypothetical protein AAGA80_21645, partial [Cyanobacteria bacterium P01_F01_bin.143]